MVRIPTTRTPTHPGEMLFEEFLCPLGLTLRDLADAINMPYQEVNNLVNGQRGITPLIASQLARVFETSAEFWENLQLRFDLFDAAKEENET